jgi:hypothetical protein
MNCSNVWINRRLKPARTFDTGQPTGSDGSSYLKKSSLGQNNQKIEARLLWGSTVGLRLLHKGETGLDAPHQQECHSFLLS